MTSIVGILLAAGRSRRMGRTKQLLPWPTAGGRTTVVAAAFDAIAPACTAMLVVVGHEADAIIAALGDRPCSFVHADPDAPMFESLRAGLDQLGRDWPAAAGLVLPADLPAIARSTLDALVTAHGLAPAHVIRPRCGDRGGHPVVIPATMIDALRANPGTRGLRGFLAEHPGDVRDVPVDDPAVIRDMDDEAAYQRAMEEASRQQG